MKSLYFAECKTGLEGRFFQVSCVVCLDGGHDKGEDYVTHLPCHETTLILLRDQRARL